MEHKRDLLKDTRVLTNGIDAFVSVICPKCHKNYMFVGKIFLSDWERGWKRRENGLSMNESFPMFDRSQCDALEHGDVCYDCKYRKRK